MIPSGAPLPTDLETLASQFSSTRKILKAHSGGGGGFVKNAPARAAAVRRSGPPGTHVKKGSTAALAAATTINEEKESSTALTAAAAASSTSSLPHGLAPMVAPSASSTGGLKSADEPLMTDKQSLCIDILVGGHVNSFVDFFYLTHRAEDDASASASGGGGGGSGGASVQSHPPPIPDAKLGVIKQHLTDAERAHRRGDSEQVYESYEALAHDFHATQDYKTSIYFYERCGDLAESMEDLAQQCNSNLNLGLTHDAMGDTAAAIRFHEKHKEIAQAMGAQSRIQTANQQLVEAYRRYAEEHERKDDNATAVLLYKRCLAAAQESNDLRSEGLATYRLGVACAAMGEKNESIEFQQKYLHICKRIGDQLGTARREATQMAGTRAPCMAHARLYAVC